MKPIPDKLRWLSLAFGCLTLLSTMPPALAQLDQQYHQQNSARTQAANDRLAMQQRCIEIIRTANYSNPKDAPYGTLKGWMRVDANGVVNWVSSANLSSGLSSAFECGAIAKLAVETRLNGWLHKTCPKILSGCTSVKTLIKKKDDLIIVYQEVSPGYVKASALVPVVMTMDSTGRLEVEYK